MLLEWPRGRWRPRTGEAEATLNPLVVAVAVETTVIRSGDGEPWRLRQPAPAPGCNACEGAEEDGAAAGRAFSTDVVNRDAWLGTLLPGITGLAEGTAAVAQEAPPRWGSAGDVARAGVALDLPSAVAVG